MKLSLPVELLLQAEAETGVPLVTTIEAALYQFVVKTGAAEQKQIRLETSRWIAAHAQKAARALDHRTFFEEAVRDAAGCGIPETAPTAAPARRRKDSGKS